MGQSHFKTIEYTIRDGMINYKHKANKLNPIYDSPSTYMYHFEYMHDMDIKLLKPFFDSKMAFVMYDRIDTISSFNGAVERTVQCSYTYEGLEYITKNLPKTQLSIVIFGDADIVNQAKKIVELCKDTTKRSLINYMTRVLEESETPPKYVEETTKPSAPSAPGKEI